MNWLDYKSSHMTQWYKKRKKKTNIVSVPRCQCPSFLLSTTGKSLWFYLCEWEHGTLKNTPCDLLNDLIQMIHNMIFLYMFWTSILHLHMQVILHAYRRKSLADAVPPHKLSNLTDFVQYVQLSSWDEFPIHVCVCVWGLEKLRFLMPLFSSFSLSVALD